MCIEPSDNNKNKKIKYQFAYMSFDLYQKNLYQNPPFLCNLLLEIVQFVWVKNQIDDVEVSKTHRNTCTVLNMIP